jgi:hypothetical protein
LDASSVAPEAANGPAAYLGEGLSGSGDLDGPRDGPLTDAEYLRGCPAEVWDGPYLYRCALGGDGLVCAQHGRFERARRCTRVSGCGWPLGHGGTCDPETGPLTAAEYTHGLDVIASAVRILRFAPVDRLLATLGPVEALAPVLEPTAFVRGGGRNLDHQRRLLEAVQGVLAVVEQIERGAGR